MNILLLLCAGIFVALAGYFLFSENAKERLIPGLRHTMIFCMGLFSVFSLVLASLF